MGPGRTILRGLLLLAAAAALAAPIQAARAADPFEDARKAFRRDAKAADAKVRALAYRTLGSFDRPESVEEVVAALAKEETATVQVAAIRTLAWMESQPSVDALAGAARSKTGYLKLLLLAALGDQRGPPATAALVEIMQGKDPQAAAQAALALGKRRAAAAAPQVKALLGSEDWHLRSAAARALTGMAGLFEAKDVLPALASALAASLGRERADLIAALKALSHLKYENDPDAWTKVASGAPPASIVAKPEPPSYFVGLPIYGRRVVLLIDNGIRTDDSHPYPDKDRLKALCEVPGARAVPWYEIRTIRQFTHAHARRTILDLPSKTAQFELISVGLKPKGVFGKLTPANEGNKQAVEDFLKGLKGETQHDDFTALSLALDLAGSKDSVAWGIGPDEIAYVTCQGPWLAKVTDVDEIAAAIGLKARFRMVPIHTVGIGDHPQAYLRSMSEMSGGTYLDLRQ